MAQILWRIISDYTGAGRYVLEDDRVVVGTDYGVECVPRAEDAPDGWKAELGSRCLGVSQRPDGSVLATCRGGIFHLSAEGVEEREKLFAEQLAAEAVPFHGGLLVLAGTGLAFYRDWGQPAWRYDLREALGKSIESVRPVHLFSCGGKAVCGAVDYDSGIGRVIVLEPQGTVRWMSEPGPVSEVFPVSDAAFFWSLTGYGKFESHLSRLDGEEIWNLDVAGVGTVTEDGLVALLVGSNEAPTWDHWIYRQVDVQGRPALEVRATGRAPVRPLSHDGAVYFLGYVLHLDPSSSRVDYTNFFAMPQEIHFQHLTGIRKQVPEYEIHLQRVGRKTGAHETLQRIQGSFSLAPPRVTADAVVFCDGRDLVAVRR